MLNKISDERTELSVLCTRMERAIINQDIVAIKNLFNRMKDILKIDTDTATQSVQPSVAKLGSVSSKISSMLDAVADSLEAKGLIKEAYEIDKVADKISRNEGDWSENLDADVDDMKRAAITFMTTWSKLDKAFREDDLEIIGQLYPSFKSQSENLAKHMYNFTGAPFQSPTHAPAPSAPPAHAPTHVPEIPVF
jgi:hypothetical protein